MSLEQNKLFYVMCLSIDKVFVPSLYVPWHHVQLDLISMLELVRLLGRFLSSSSLPPTLSSHTLVLSSST